MSLIWFKDIRSALHYRGSSKYRIFSCDINEHHAKKFTVATAYAFWKYYRNLKHKNYYEIILEDTPCYLYLDIDIPFSLNTVTICCLTKTLKDMLQMQLAMELHIYILECSTNSKFSQHWICRNVYFKNNKVLKKIINYVIDILKSSENSHLFFFKHNGLKKCAIDMTVYGRNQQFRLLGSYKFNDYRPLTYNNCYWNQISIKLFIKTLVCIPDVCSCIRDGVAYNGLEIIKKDVMKATSDINENVNKIMSDVDDDFIKLLCNNLKKWDTGTGSVYKTINEEQLIILYMKNNRFCRIKNGYHRNNNIYFTFVKKSNKLFQHCFSEKCRSMKRSVFISKYENKYENKGKN